MINRSDFPIIKKLIEKFGGKVNEGQLNSAIDAKVADGTIASGEQLEHKATKEEINSANAKIDAFQVEQSSGMTDTGSLELKATRINAKGQKFSTSTKRIDYLEVLIKNKYTNIINSGQFVKYTSVGGFPYTIDYADTEKQVVMPNMTSAYARLQVYFNAEANRKYLALVSCKIITPNPTQGCVNFSKINGNGTTAHPFVALNIKDINGKGLYSAPNVTNTNAPLGNSYIHSGLIYDSTTKEEVCLQISFEDTSKLITFAYKEIIIIDITDNYNTSDVQKIVDSGYFQYGIPYLANDVNIQENVVKIDTLASRVDVLENANNEKKNDVLWGKTLATAGDSITYGHSIEPDTTTGVRMTYGAIVANNHNMTFYNYGISGSTLQNVEGKNPFCVDRYLNMTTDIDYLTIWFGWNDHAYGVIGTISDTVDTTFYGAWNKIIPVLIKKYPLTKIGLVVPYGCNTDFREAVRQISRKWGIPCLDLYDSVHTPLFYEHDKKVDYNAEVSSILTFRKNTFLADGVHPNYNGYKYLSTIFENFLRSL